MTTRTAISPAALLVALLCFGLPFIAVSCETSKHSISAEYTGWDMVVGGSPDMVVTPPTKTPPEAKKKDDMEPRPLAVLSLLLIVGAAIAAPTRARAVVKAAITGAAAVLLTLNQVLVSNGIEQELERSGSPAVVDSRIGFWLVLLLLLGITAHQSVQARRSRLKPPATPIE